MWYRDAWQGAGRVPIEEGNIGISGQPISQLTIESWRSTLREAYECLDADKGYRGRATQVVTLKSGKVERPVSPHLQFRIPIGSAMQLDWASRLTGARQVLVPLYEYVVGQSRA
jgi:hypothetical protein